MPYVFQPNIRMSLRALPHIVAGNAYSILDVLTTLALKLQKFALSLIAKPEK